MSTVVAEAARQPDRLPTEVLAALVNAAQQGLRQVGGGCLLHDTGRVRWLGGVFTVKFVLFEHHYGAPVPHERVLIRTCATPDCLAPTCQVVVARSDWGRALGRRGGLWRPAA